MDSPVQPTFVVKVVKIIHITCLNSVQNVLDFVKNVREGFFEGKKWKVLRVFLVIGRYQVIDARGWNRI